MANRYANLIGSNKIKDEYTKINTGFDGVQSDMDATNQKIDNHIGSGGTAHATATGSAAGFMSAGDKTKLDGIEAGAEVNQNAFTQVNDVPAGTPEDMLTVEGGTGIVVTTNPAAKKVIITATGEATPAPHGSSHTSDGSDPIPNATTTRSGLMSAADKTKLDSIPNDIQSQLDGLSADVSTVQNDLATHEADYKSHVPYATATGSANAYAVTLNPAPTAYVEGMALSVKINADNTGAATINVNGLGAKAIKKANGSDVSAGGLKAGGVYTLRYDGSAFILQGEGRDDIPASDIRAGAVYDGIVGTYTSDATATAADIQQGLVAYANGQRLVGTSTRKRWATGTLNGSLNSNLTFNILGLSFTPGFVAYYTIVTGNLVFGIANINAEINATRSTIKNNVAGTWTNSPDVGSSNTVEFGSNFINNLYKPGNQVQTIKWIAIEGSF